MIVEVLNTGSELLLGQVNNTHLGYFARRLSPMGLRISRQVTLPDGNIIREGLSEALARSDVLLLTGGLGPTSDDLTRDLVSAHFSRPLEFHPKIQEVIHARFRARDMVPPAIVDVQAMVPKGAIVLPNAHGTAPGLYLEDGGKHVFCLPGPPRELYPMFENHVEPVLRRLAGGIPPLHMETLRIYGIGESRVQEMAEKRLRALCPEAEIGYCARPNEVDLRLIAPSPETLASLSALGREIFGREIYATGEELMEGTVIRLATEKGLLLAAAESCTGGLVAHRLTNIPGASAVVDRTWVTYSNEAKQEELGVPADLLAQYGAVSAPVAEAMARGAVDRSRASLALSLTGIAGPGGGTPEKPVGTVHIGLAIRKDGKIHATSAEKRLAAPREAFKSRASQAALDMLRRALSDF